MTFSGGQTQDRVIFGRVAVRGSRLDPVVARLSVEGALREVAASSAGLSPSAILCIRKVEDPMPGRLRADTVDRSPPRGWQSALARRIEELGRRAARPWMEAVPAAALAVLFADTAELLACAASDIVRGGTSGAWWYEEIFRGPASRSAVLRAWHQDVEYAPMALSLLSSRRQAVDFASALDPGEAISLVGALVERFGLSALHRSLAEARRGGAERAAPVEGGHEGSGAGRESAGPRQSAGKRSRTGEWRAPGGRAGLWAPEVPETAELRVRGPVESELFLGVALTLARAPESARRATFARQAAAFVSRADARPSEDGPGAWPAGTFDGPPVVEGRISVLPVAESRPPAGDAGETANAPVEGSPDVQGDTSWTEKPSLGAGRSASEGPTGSPVGHGRADIEAPRETMLAALAVENDPTREDAAVVNVDSVDDSGDPPASPSARRGDREELESGPPPGAVTAAEPPVRKQHVFTRFGARRAVSTRLGGLFFLVNLALYLELYGDFTTPLSPGIDLPIWDFVTLVGRALLPDVDLDDPVFALLADLAGRPHDGAPGATFEPPAEWRVPASWLSPFAARSSKPWAWASDGARLTIWHPAGFVVLDVPAESDVAAQVAREMATFGAIAGVSRPPFQDARGGAPSLAWWLGQLLPYVRARLDRALAAGEGVDSSALLLRLGATVRVSEARLEVEMSLAELPIEIRLSGLDRDPGWVPAAGRSVTFHFEA